MWPSMNTAMDPRTRIVNLNSLAQTARKTLPGSGNAAHGPGGAGAIHVPPRQPEGWTTSEARRGLRAPPLFGCSRGRRRKRTQPMSGFSEPGFGCPSLPNGDPLQAFRPRVSNSHFSFAFIMSAQVTSVFL